jgi:deoxyribodipyrimidine photolyase
MASHPPEKINDTVGSNHRDPTELLNKLQLPAALRARINCSSISTSRSNGSTTTKTSSTSCSTTTSKPSFVLYLPFVNLRMKHNAAFALACRLANELGVPLLTLAVIPDQYHHSHDKSNSNSEHHNNNKTDENENESLLHTTQVFMTARRLAFMLEALQECTQQWSQHGALSFVRVHGPKCRVPDHLTLATRAMAVVTDEPFVNPWLHLVQATERACAAAGVPCYRVDASTTVPPLGKLRRLAHAHASEGGKLWDGVPSRAFMWKAKSKSDRQGQYDAAMAGNFDAPPLRYAIPIEEQHAFNLFESKGTDSDSSTQGLVPILHTLTNMFPSPWKATHCKAPGTRPWATNELADIPDLKQWVMNEWPGADTSVPPCPQTVGTTTAGMERWRSWLQQRSGISKYARLRNDPTQPHAVSRMSAYLNFGIVSIFDLYHDISQSKETQSRDKFIDEIIKWREFSHAHAFSRTDYFQPSCVPPWARTFLSSPSSVMAVSAPGAAKTVEQMLTATTGDSKWDAMQRYLIRTGELHNNVRMTWGKTVVFWGRQAGWSCDRILQVLALLNDRFALDGVSPPSYAGLLWCCGWGDKPSGSNNGGINPKPASRYKTSPPGFDLAEQRLLQSPASATSSSSKNMSTTASLSILSFAPKRNSGVVAITSSSPTKRTSSHSGGILQFTTIKRKREQPASETVTGASASPSINNAQKRQGSATPSILQFATKRTKETSNGEDKSLFAKANKAVELDDGHDCTIIHTIE